MSSYPRELVRLLGEVPDLPIPLYHEAPLPNELVDPEIAHALLGLTEEFGGDAAFAKDAFDTIGLPLVVTEASLIRRAYPGASLKKIGMIPEVQASATDRYGGVDSTLGIPLRDYVAPLWLIRYFGSVSRCILNCDKTKYEAAAVNLTLLPQLVDMEAVGSDFVPMLGEMRAGNVFGQDELLAELDMDRKDVAEVAARLRDSTHNYAARLIVASTVLAVAQAPEMAGSADTKSSEAVGASQVLLDAIRAIMKDGRLDNLAARLGAIRQLYPPGVHIAHLLQTDAAARQCLTEKYNSRLESRLSALDALARGRTIVGIREGVPIWPDTNPGLTEPEADGQISKVILRALDAVDAKLKTSAAKSYPGYSSLARAMVSGTNVYGIELPNILDRDVPKVLRALTVLDKYRSGIGTERQRRAMVSGLRECYSVLREEQEITVPAVTTVRQASSIPSESDFHAGLRCVMQNLGVMAKAVQSFNFGTNAQQFVRLLTELSST